MNRVRRLSRMLEGYRPFIAINDIKDIIEWDDSKECFRTSFERESSDGSVFSSIVERQFNVNVNGAYVVSPRVILVGTIFLGLPII